MFHKISPQKVQHSDGYIVQVVDRYAVQYLDREYQASIEVDFGAGVGVYRDSLRVQRVHGEEVQVSSTEGQKIVERIASGIEAMGSTVEICYKGKGDATL